MYLEAAQDSAASPQFDQPFRVVRDSGPRCPVVPREEASMWAVVGQVSIQPGREDESQEYLTANVLPRVKQAPGVVAGYWVAPQDGHGLGITLYESEEAARGGAEMARKGPTPDYVTFDSIDVREVIAQI
jgi:hypothetical protein